MANEITISHQLSITKTSLRHEHSDTYRATLAGTKYDSKVVQATTTAAALTIAVTAGGIAYFKNLDATNYVDVGVDDSGTFVPFIRLKAGESFTVRLATVALYVRANTASVNIEYKIFEA